MKSISPPTACVPFMPILLLAAPAMAQPLAINWSTIDSGGGASAGGAYALVGVIGQPDTGAASGGAYALRAGFMAGIDATTCAADCDGSAELDFFDFLCFQNAFSAGEPYADCDGSGELDFFDFLCFQNEFAAGCP